ncbi:ectoine/hydroxyectoine ABC transporter permease subunit EhuD [Naumannella sp. ID2617S]|nr:ectoine/hydroxyectoine ABC transporter permease subunit EhuD [Naumannella sp. ID2617S]
MTWDNAFAAKILPLLLQGLLTTVEITLIGFAIAAVLGLIWAILRRLGIPVLSQVVTFCVLFVRGTPLLVQAYCAYFILPNFGLTFGAFETGVAVIGINYSAYLAEVYRAGIEAVPKGQWEAATALNLSQVHTWRRIVLPQAIRVVLPMMGNYLIAMFKDSAVLSAITVVDLMATAQSIGSSNFRYLEPLTIAGLLFLLVSYPASVLISRLEARHAD